MKKYREIRKITMHAVRGMCVRNGLYTCGSGEDYRKMLLMAAEKYVVELDDLAAIAEDIAAHSDGLFDAKEVLGLLSKEAVDYCYEIADTEEEATC